MSTDTLTPLQKTIAYFYNENTGGYFDVESYQLKPDGSYSCGEPIVVYIARIKWIMQVYHIRE